MPSKYFCKKREEEQKTGKPQCQKYHCQKLWIQQKIKVLICIHNHKPNLQCIPNNFLFGTNYESQDFIGNL